MIIEKVKKYRKCPALDFGFNPLVPGLQYLKIRQLVCLERQGLAG